MVKKMPKLLMAKTIMGMEKGLHEESPYVEKILTEHLTLIAPNPITANIDGEKITSDNFNITVLKNNMKVYKDKELVKKINA